MNAYADPSFFVSLYLSDQHSLQAQTWASLGIPIWLTPLHVAEWVHAVEQHVFRGQISKTEAQRIHARFSSGRESGVWVEQLVPESAYERCAQLGLGYSAQIGLRTLDTLQVAVALELNANTFWTFDHRQRKLAVTVGMKVQ